MKKLIQKIMALGTMLALTACGGSGGGSNPANGGGNTGGSATFTNLSSGSSGFQCSKNNTLAANYNIPDKSSSCTSAGGTWLSHSVITSEFCQLSGINYSLIGGGTADNSDKLACTNAGGTFIASISQNQNYCSGYTSLTCAQAGGIQVVVDETIGDLHVPMLIAGSNTITIDGISNSNISGVNSNPVYFIIHSKILYFGSEFWQADITSNTGGSFSGLYGHAEDIPTFTISLPVGSSSSVEMHTATLYTDR